jgi:hypothetical protein
MSLLQRTVWVVNRVGEAARSLGVPVARLSATALEQAAATEVGSIEFGNGYYREGLRVLVDAIEDDAASIHVAGRLHLRSLLVRELVTRLRLRQALRRNPALEHGPKLPPLVVCGLPRSGTTFLHRLLAEPRDARPLPLWELMEPLPGPGPDRRLATARARMERLAALTHDELDSQHLVRAELPDECGHLFKSTFFSSIYWQAPLYRYLEWYLRADPTPAYRDYRALLAALERPGQRLVLKDPFHARHLPSLLEVLPAANVVMIHRDPVEVVPSFHKLTLSVHRVFSDAVDTRRVVELNTRWLHDLAQRSLDARPSLPSARIFDVGYRELLADPVGVVARIHERFGLPLAPPTRERLERYVAEHPQRQYGTNAYRVEDYGQRSEALAERFAEYRGRFIE